MRGLRRSDDVVLHFMTAAMVSDKTATASAVYVGRCGVTDVLVQGSGSIGLCALWGSVIDCLSVVCLSVVDCWLVAVPDALQGGGAHTMIK